MDWPGFVAIACLALVLGVVLYIPGRWWAKHRLRNAPSGSRLRLRVTAAGFAVCVLMVGVLIAGSSQQYWAPQTQFGQFVATGVGRLVFWSVVAVSTIVLCMILEMLGFTLFKHPDNTDE